MKKSNNFLLALLCCFSFSSCDNNDINDTKTKLIISEVVEGNSSDRAIELYNISDETISLNDYLLEIHLKNSVSTIDFSSTLKPNETFLIVHENACEELLSKADLITSQLTFNGSQPIVLKTKKKNKQVDIVGILDNQIDYYKDLTLTRKKEFLVGRKSFDEYDWIRYNTGNFKYLNTIDVSITNDELLSGPCLTNEYLSLPFYKLDSYGNYIGGGGVMNVDLISNIDGDTSTFRYDTTIISVLGIQQGTKLRYQNIDTPESYAGNVQEFGLMAKAYTKHRLEEAFEIQVQSVLDGAITETFGRMLGWVWIDGELLNHSIVKMGYSNLNFSTNDMMLYKDVSYTNFLYDAQLYATKNKLGIHGEIDPYWDYENNRVKDNVSGINPFK